ncbi:MAG: class I SAM-dependent methyltransferase [Caldilineaceae bacterium]
MNVTTFNTGIELLDQVNSALLHFNNIDGAMDELCCSLKDIHNLLTDKEWKEFASQCTAHPLRVQLHQDPLTNRAFTKPRGYPGDARLMDFIYRSYSVQAEVNSSTPLGRKLYEYTSNSPAACAVRFRRDFAARAIDNFAEEVDLLHILSVACGHMDEARCSYALSNGHIGKYVGFDQDAQSLQFVRKELGHLPIQCVQGSVQELIYGKKDLGKYDFVYSLGLFDYLPRTVAKLLTETMFNLLNPGGRLLIANFAKGIRDIGYMESFMDWKLIYRSVEEMAELAEDITDSFADKHVFKEENQTVVFLSIRKS